MTIIDNLERKFPWFGFRNLNLYMVIIFSIGIIINMINPLYYLYFLSLNVERIISGEIWRLFTFIFYPLSSGRSILLSLLMLYVYYSITKTLVLMWGNFKFNLYLFIGYISQVLGAFILYFVFKQNVILYPAYTTFSLIMAFALSFPDAHFLIYFVIPIKAKYFAYIEMAFYIISFIGAGVADRVAIICSAVNVFVFFVLLKNRI